MIGITVAHAAKILGVHPHTVRTKIKAGEIPASRFKGRRIIIPRDAFLSYIEPLGLELTSPKTIDANKPALSVDEAAAKIGLGRTKLYSFIKDGTLPVRKIGRRTIVLPEDLEAFVKSLPVKVVNK